MQHFYDGQIRRYITQTIRLLSNFSYKDGKGQLTTIPVTYGDLTRQVANIMRDNSENKIPSAPRMAVYITGLEMDRSRSGDSSYVNKLNVRERAYDADGNEYLNKEGKNYTVERLMPSPYTLTLNVDIWSTNTDQKLQIMEQILQLFNPSLEIQTTDNYVDWTSLSVINLDNISFSNRSIPVGVESEIDIATLTFTTPIYITPPAKVKRLGVITNILTSIFDDKGDVDIGDAVSVAAAVEPRVVTENPDVNININVAEVPTGQVETLQTKGSLERGPAKTVIGLSHNNPNLLVMNNTLKLVKNGIVGGESWIGYLKAIPAIFTDGVSQIRLTRNDLSTEISGTMAINPDDPYTVTVNWDNDTIPSDSVITGPNGDKNKIDYIIDPTKSNPQDLGLSGNPRILLLGPIGDESNTDGPDAWKNLDGTDFIANTNDLVEWSGTAWSIVMEASKTTDTIYTTNLNTGIQYKFTKGEWLLSFEGEYPDGAWRIEY